jgi:putative N6-adenine-specific DNA methylase
MPPVARYLLAAAASFGMESVVASELRALGFGEPKAENGRVLFEGTEDDLARVSLWLRAADRLLVRLSDFPAGDFDALFEGVRAIPWRDILPGNPRLLVTARSARSRLTATPSIQSVGKKAIVDALAGGRGGRIEETGPLYPVEIALAADRASISLDASGDGLHRRGYRTEAGEAPLKETLAAGMVLLSRWEPARPFADPMCGSGTLAIEAALIGLGRPPGAGRSFTAEAWPHVPAEAWRRAREEAEAAIRRPAPALRITASDRDSGMVSRARRNARRAGVEGSIGFSVCDAEAAGLDGEYGCLVTNPPYAERLGDEREAAGAARLLGRLGAAHPTWSVFALSGNEGFEGHFGVRASRKRKLYNGNLRCQFYQYFGPLPRGPAEDAPPGRAGQ